ncbi:MAG: DUF1580 domain-containing protein [Planctomycetes bacterium]|nr:DUF1580 domain-containing protein [Planctomycetota bacterium]
MIDLFIENVLTLQDAAATLPRRRRGARPHVATLFRWASAGCRGVRLETIQVGGTKCTSTEALSRFFQALSQPRETINERPERTTKCRERDIARAEAECKAAGI